MQNTRSRGIPLSPFNPEIQRALRGMANNNNEGNVVGDETADRLRQKQHNDPQRVPLQPPHNVGLQPPQNQGLHQQQPLHQGLNQQQIARNIHGVDDDTMGSTGAILLPPLPPGSKFCITSGLIQMLHSRGLFSGLASEDPHNHLINVAYVRKSGVGDPNLTIDVIGLRVFPISLAGNAAVWLSELPYNSITTWEQLCTAFNEKYF